MSYATLYKQLQAQGLGQFNGVDRADELAKAFSQQGISDLSQLRGEAGAYEYDYGKEGEEGRGEWLVSGEGDRTWMPYESKGTKKWLAGAMAGATPGYRLKLNGGDQDFKHFNIEGGSFSHKGGARTGDQIAYSAAGNDGTEYYIKGLDKNGIPQLAVRKISSDDDLPAIRAAAAVAALMTGGAALGAGSGAAAGGTAAGTAAGGAAGGSWFTMPSLTSIGKSAVANGLLAEATGGKFVDGFKAGVVSGGLAGFTPAAGMGLSGVTGSVVNGAARAGIGAALNGGNVGKALLTGGVTAGINSWNPAQQLGITDKTAAQVFNRAVNNMVARGASPKDAFKSAVLSGAGGILSGAAKSAFDGGGGDPELIEGSMAPGGKYYDLAHDDKGASAMSNEDWEDPMGGHDYGGDSWSIDDFPTTDGADGTGYADGVDGDNFDQEAWKKLTGNDGFDWSKLFGTGTNRAGRPTFSIGGVDFETSDLLRLIGGGALSVTKAKNDAEARKAAAEEAQKNRDWQDKRKKEDQEREERLQREKWARMGVGGGTGLLTHSWQIPGGGA